MRKVSVALTAICILFFAVSAFGARTLAERDYSFAQGMKDRGLHRLAAKEYLNFIRKYPDHEWVEFAYYNLGLIYKETKDYEKSVLAWQEFQRKYPNSQYYIESFFETAEMLLDLGTELLEKFEEINQVALRDRGLENLRKSAQAYREYLQKGEGKIPDNKAITAHFNIAYCYEKTGDFSRAILEYEKLAADFRDYEAQYRIGETYHNMARSTQGELQTRNYNNAFNGYRAILLFGQTEFYDDAKIGMALVRFETGKYEEARNILIEDIRAQRFQKVYRDWRNNPNNVHLKFVEYLEPQAYFIIAECYEKENNLDEAKRILDLIVERFASSQYRAMAQKKIMDLLHAGGVDLALNTPNGARRAIEVARKYNESGEFRKAIEELHKVRRAFKGFRDPANDALNKDFLSAFSFAYYGEGSYLESAAIAEYLGKVTNATTESSYKGQALYYAGSAYWSYAERLKNDARKGSFQLRAIRQFELLAITVPAHEKAAEVQLNCANYYLKLENYERAAANYAGYLDKFKNTSDSSYAEALFNLGYCYITLERYADAEHECSRYVQLYQGKQAKVIDAINLLGASMIRQDKYLEAVKVFEKLDPSAFTWVGEDVIASSYRNIFEDAHYQIGFCYYKAGDFERAISKYNYFIENFPDNQNVPRSRLLIAQLYFDRNEYENVVRILGEFLQKYRTAPDAYKGYILLTESYLKTADFPKALQTAREMFATYGKNELTEGAYRTIANIMSDAGQHEGVILAYEELIKDYAEEYDILERGLWSFAEYCFEKDELARAEKYYSEYLSVATENLRREGRRNVVPARWFDLQFRIGEIREKLGKYEDAEKSYNNVAARAVRTTEPELIVKAQYKIGHMWLKADNPKRALGTLLRIAYFQDAKDPVIRNWVGLSTFEAGIAHKRNNEPEKAKDMLNRFLKEFDEDDFTEYRKRAEEELKEI